jgi:hypothetical protein
MTEGGGGLANDDVIKNYQIFGRFLVISQLFRPPAGKVFWDLVSGAQNTLFLTLTLHNFHACSKKDFLIRSK